MTRVVVVGAGVGGLACAARLAAAGHAVTVCEAAAQVGGKLGLVEEHGFRFDTGPSLLTLPQVFADLFAATGDPLDTVLTLRPVDPLAAYHFADGTRLTAPTGVTQFAAALDRTLGPPSGAEWTRLMVQAGRMWSATEQPFLRSPLAGPRTLARLALRTPRAIGTIAPTRSLRDLGRAALSDPRLRMLLDRYATYTGSDPRRAPAVLATVPWVEQTFGGWYVDGGLYRLAEALAARAVERGAVLRLQSPVTRVLLAGDRVSGVELADGGRLPAEVVVANADAATVYYRLLDAPTATRGARRRLDRAAGSLSGFVLLLGLRGRTPGLAHHTVLFPVDYDAEFDAVFGPSARPVADPTLYLSVPDDPAVRPHPDSEAWFVLVNAARQGTTGHAGTLDWDAPGRTEAYAEHLLDLLARRGLPVRDRLLSCRVLSPADLERRTGAPGGAIYGTASHGPAAAFLRPANRGALRGLFLVGGSAHPGGGLPLVTLSAQIVAALVGSP